jgi:hypothetical protein
LSIISDYDLSQKDQIIAARNILDLIKANADEEEATGFDPSGSSGEPLIPDVEITNARSESVPEWGSSTDNTSVSQEQLAGDFQGLELSNSSGANSLAYPEAQDEHGTTLSENYTAKLESLDQDAKEAVLIETFPSLTPFDIKWTLNKCKNNAGQALEELLNQICLEETGSRRRGIEAFSETELPVRAKKGKGKKKRPKFNTEDTYAKDDLKPEGPISSKWETARQDIEFLSAHTNIPMDQISFLYHANSASVPSTINALIAAHSDLGLSTQEASTQRAAQDLGRDFPTIPLQKLLALVQLAAPQQSSAYDLAKALTTRPVTNGTSGRNTPIQISYRLPPPDLAESSDPAATKPYSYNAVHVSSPGSSTISENLSPVDLRDLQAAAYIRASAAYKKGKSNPLMGGAAAYYSSVGREISSQIHRADERAADSIAAKQSTANGIDLHGIDVKNAVRIVRDRITAWWASMGGVRGEERGIHAGYRIVVGRGTHSEGGVGKLGPAVYGMLVREGWRVEKGTGWLVVTGVVGGR